MEIKTVAVLGSGTMGHAIAQVCAQGGCRVFLIDIKEELVRNGLARIKKFIQGSVERKKMSAEEAEQVLSRIKTTTEIKTAVQDADLVIEAIVEELKIKHDTWRQVDEAAPGRTIFATNTSYLSVTEIASVTRRPDKFLGMHWFNPPQIMRGIEVVHTEKTSPEVRETVLALCRQFGKEPAVCKDSPGFIANRLLGVCRAESLKLYDRQVASFQDIDTAFKAGYNFRMGQFELADLVGLDVALIGARTLYQELGREAFSPARCLVMKNRAGDFGRKTGRGFYEYQ